MNLPMASGDRPDTSRKKSKGSAEKLSPKEQRERFIETARKLQADESGKKFDEALKRVARSRQPQD